jgi:transcriptional regulator with XRE-family HTH domain
MVHTATPAQLRAARALIGWSQTDLADASGVSVRTIKKLELAPNLAPLPGRPATVERLLLALSAAGVRMTRGRGALGVSLSLPVPALS